MQQDIAPPKSPSPSQQHRKAKPRRASKIPFPANASGNLKKTIFGLIILALIIAPSAYFYKKSQDAEKKLANSSEVNQKVVDDVVSKVNRLYLLPTDEKPTLVTVTDVSKVKEQPFFSRAENGDKALVYTQSRKAILYRPSKDVVVEVAPLNVDSLPSDQQGTSADQN